jgi:nickel superoxide dismutase
MKRLTFISTTVLLLLVISASVFAHCQVPCGIYGDKTRFDMLREHITTLEKSMNQINKLSADAANNMNQLVRWVNNKEKHADEFTEIVTYYFLAQRIKVKEKSDAAFADYQNKLTLLHGMMFSAMKAKQTTDLKHIEKLKTLVDEFEGVYFSKEDKKHLKEHK